MEAMREVDHQNGRAPRPAASKTEAPEAPAENNSEFDDLPDDFSIEEDI